MVPAMYSGDTGAMMILKYSWRAPTWTLYQTAGISTAWRECCLRLRLRDCGMKPGIRRNIPMKSSYFPMRRAAESKADLPEGGRSWDWSMEMNWTNTATRKDGQSMTYLEISVRAESTSSRQKDRIAI